MHPKQPTQVLPSMLADGVARLLGWLARQRLIVRFGKFATVSLVASVCSQLTLMGLYGIGTLPATAAGLAAFAVGAVINFTGNRRWVWGRWDRLAFTRELLPYLAVIAIGGLASTGLVTLADHWLTAHLLSRGARMLVLDAVYVGSYGLLAVAKFAVLDRFVFRGGNQARATA